ncbi:ATP adenylyltransferase family protein [Thioalkalivibrio sp.]|uniref:ATP adenylyltransferase family protein n=1 Tax=Thioalkalivibrio sp. TaxID=2093813 RepID=UPI00356503F2
MRTEILLEPGSLAEAVDEATRCALAAGVLVPIETEQERIADAGVCFLLRVVASLRRKASGRPGGAGGQRRPADPFLPPEPELTVAEVSSRHLAVLNKFNVLERHLLIVTRAFEPQETLLSPGDLRALFACMAEYPSLGFYNGGTVAGASQAHKHLQLVPLPFEPDGPAFPMQPLMDAGTRGSVGRCPDLPFAHAFARLDQPVAAAPMEAAEQAGALYLELLTAVGIEGRGADGAVRQSAPYNLLVADDWMLVVPRAGEFFRGVSVNALGFAGSLFVKDRRQLEVIRAAGPMHILRTVAGSPREPT